MTTTITTNIKRKEIDELEIKAKAKGITKCAYVRNLIRNDLKTKNMFIEIVKENDFDLSN